ncbi:atp-dependent protease la type ii [hydrocarbon metagenome]|uniref:Atp-dependent protease la type ii n=1 Tax=hydrocarbon metagenome TaxID=938273 RepID=A0A0W8E328_9ZZZZ
MNYNQYRLKPGELRKKCNPSGFKFNSTADVKPLTGIIGQERALNAISIGLDIESEGYNIYLAGQSGTGKTTLASKMLHNKARKKPVPPDWCYVYNFKNPDTPCALKIPAGNGKKLKQELASCIDEAIEAVIIAFAGEEYTAQKNIIFNDFVTETNALYLALDLEARAHGFSISQNQQGGVNTIPINKNGEVMGQDEYVGLSEEERAAMMSNSAMVQEKMNEAMRKYRSMEKLMKDKLKILEQETAQQVSQPQFDNLLSKYHRYQQVLEYLAAVQEDFLAHLDVLVHHEENTALSFFRHIDKRSFLRRYQINLLVDNSEGMYAPVVFENNPTFANLFGQIEYEGEFGILATDFSKIRAGSIHRANGGYLVLRVYDLLKNGFVWDTLKRIIKNKEISVENISRMIGITNTETLQPEPIPLDIKVILIGESLYYYLLHHYDQEFSKLFKIRADFDDEMNRSRRHVNDYVRLISSVCETENLKHFKPEAVASLVEYGSRMTDDQQKLSTSFNKLMELIYEANCIAEYDGADLVTGEHVQKAIEQRIYRSSLSEEKLQEAINRNALIINVEGNLTGEVNGLAVYQAGEYRFGRPVRITAKTYMGEKGLVNIEREIAMSGRIHSKGILTLNGYLGHQYAQDKPLTLSASLTFEQSYQGVEGDSASSAELYALISSLAGLPINQRIAVTGSVNQNGEIQPVGGVNEKIEGFYKVCKEKGLVGNHGVIIPRKNVLNLMLDEEVVEAVRNKLFSIWAVSHIDEGLEILTGMQAGVKDERGVFPEGTVHFLANRQLEEWSLMKKKHIQEKSLAISGKTKNTAVSNRRRRRRR